MTDTIRIGFVGAGKNTVKKHIPGFKVIKGVELVSVANRSKESGQKVAQEVGLKTVYEDPYELIASDDTDAICIGTWPYMHMPLVLAALESNKHVLTEARLAMNAEEARDMVEAQRFKPKLIAQVVPAPFTFRVDNAIKDLIAEGYFGDIYAVDCSISAYQPELSPGGFINREVPFAWRHDRDLSGMNIMLMGAWYECLMRWIGPASSVLAITRTHVKERKDPAGSRRVVTIPDHVEVIAEMYSGPTLHMRVSEVTGLGPSDIWIFGCNGTARIDMTTSKIYGGKRGTTAVAELPIDEKKAYKWRAEEEFINAIRGKEPILMNTFETGLLYMEFAEAVTRSAQRGEKIALPL
ncbi:MAG: Gfo/Idh/MocA family oxidoreductase [SAR202 cluster bacterium]|nr:Gfo/Idh/MocA family oxidoreductase [SAR202 cluster bacterium]